MHAAAYAGQKEIAELFLIKGADINARDQKGRDSIMWAMEGDQGQVVEFLRNRGVKE